MNDAPYMSNIEILSGLKDVNERGARLAHDFENSACSDENYQSSANSGV